jgi:exosome complex RNA-binding protein Csl4
MAKKKLVLPGEHLLSAEEAEAGSNTYTDKDEIYSAAFGEEVVSEGKVSIQRKGKSLFRPHVDMDVYCMVMKTTDTKAICSCISKNELESKERSMEMTAVLPVRNLRKGYVNKVEDIVRIGDIIKAKISKVTKTGIDINMVGRDLGVVYARPRREK